jgi:hypothetical protein
MGVYTRVYTMTDTGTVEDAIGVLPWDSPSDFDDSIGEGIARAKKVNKLKKDDAIALVARLAVKRIVESTTDGGIHDIMPRNGETANFAEHATRLFGIDKLDPDAFLELGRRNAARPEFGPARDRFTTSLRRAAEVRYGPAADEDDEKASVPPVAPPPPPMSEEEALDAATTKSALAAILTRMTVDRPDRDVEPDAWNARTRQIKLRVAARMSHANLNNTIDNLLPGRLPEDKPLLAQFVSLFRARLRPRDTAYYSSSDANIRQFKDDILYAMNAYVASATTPAPVPPIAAPSVPPAEDIPVLDGPYAGPPTPAYLPPPPVPAFPSGIKQESVSAPPVAPSYPVRNYDGSPMNDGVQHASVYPTTTVDEHKYDDPPPDVKPQVAVKRESVLLGDYVRRATDPVALWSAAAELYDAIKPVRTHAGCVVYMRPILADRLMQRGADRLMPIAVGRDEPLLGMLVDMFAVKPDETYFFDMGARERVDHAILTNAALVFNGQSLPSVKKEEDEPVVRVTNRPIWKSWGDVAMSMLGTLASGVSAAVADGFGPGTLTDHPPMKKEPGTTRRRKRRSNRECTGK